MQCSEVVEISSEGTSSPIRSSRSCSANAPPHGSKDTSTSSSVVLVYRGSPLGVNPPLCNLFTLLLYFLFALSVRRAGEGEPRGHCHKGGPQRAALSLLGWSGNSLARIRRGVGPFRRLLAAGWSYCPA